MELYNEILSKILQSRELHITFSNFEISPTEIVRIECYKALKEIKEIIEDSSLEDCECYMKIEKIVGLFEQIGSDGGNRHDFG